MKVATVYDIDDIRIEDVPVPEIGPRDALVRMKRCGICSGDVTPWYIRRKAPIVIGHEPAGVIAEVGAEVEGFRPGDRVFIHHHAPCFRCRLCQRGAFTMCPTWKRSQLIPGGIAEYVKVPELNLRYDTLKLPDSMSFDDATLVEPTACSVKAIKRAGVRSGDTVLIIGLGFMGQVNALVARHYGAKRVIGADLVPYRLDRARALGMDATIDVSTHDLRSAVKELTGGAMADVVIVGPGSIPAMKSGLTCAGKGSTVLFFMATPEHEVLDLKPYDLYFNEISLVCSYSCGPYDTRAALDLVEMGVVTAEKLVTHRFPLEDTEAGFRKTAEAKDSLKTLIVFE
ncbi:MAG: alcohol dehydrogenase catalytic domain-containing protein [Candidatus Latescibacteria bacterium]|nr:alcohol dehydrogenase catalytic domain-containing protein [Candidatus Latescibacterota bacterium]